MTYIVCVTRFNDETYNENENWKDKHNLTFDKRFYNTSIKIKESIQPNHEIMVIEMNNSQNEIIAFGLIKNICQQWRYNIYKCTNYNRFTYISSKFLYKHEIPRDYDHEMNELTNEIFKGKGHLKRGFGIQAVPNKKLANCKTLFNYIYHTIS